MKNYRIILAVAALGLTASFVLKKEVKGKVFPEISGQTLERKNVTLPAAAKGKPTLIGMAYSKKAEDDLKTWINPAYNKFIAKSGIIDQIIDVNLYFVPMFTGTANLTADVAIKQLSEGTNRDYFPYIVCYRGKLDQYKETLEMSDKSKPYFFVLDADGKIVYTTSGAYDEKKMEEIEDKLSD